MIFKTSLKQATTRHHNGYVDNDQQLLVYGCTLAASGWTTTLIPTTND